MHVKDYMLCRATIGIHVDNLFGESEFRVPGDARLKHQVVFGASGTGKSVLLATLAASDLATTGITVIDPHGGIYRLLAKHTLPDTISGVVRISR